MTAAELGSGDGILIKNSILFSVLVYELVGPMLTKWALMKSGDIKPSSVNITERRMNKYQEALDEKQVSKASMKQARRNMEWRRKKAAWLDKKKKKA